MNTLRTIAALFIIGCPLSGTAQTQSYYDANIWEPSPPSRIPHTTLNVSDGSQIAFTESLTYQGSPFYLFQYPSFYGNYIASGSYAFTASPSTSGYYALLPYDIDYQGLVYYLVNDSVPATPLWAYIAAIFAL